MSKVLVVPDTHLKPKIFDLADKILRKNEVDYAVQLGDNFDDFYCYDDQYREHNARMVQFKYEHPETIWLWGNHELSYLLDRPVTGNIFCGKEYSKLFQENFNPKFIHLDEKVVFSHAGIFQEFLEKRELIKCKSIDELVKMVNQLNLEDFWVDESPIWARPQIDNLTVPEILNGYLQIVGHTPMKNIEESDGIISVDVFSTDLGKQYGEEKMMIVDTEKSSYEIVDIDFRKVFGEER